MNLDHRSEAKRLLAESDRLRAQIDRARADGQNDAATETHLWRQAESAERRAQVHAALAIGDRLASLNFR